MVERIRGLVSLSDSLRGVRAAGTVVVRAGKPRRRRSKRCSTSSPTTCSSWRRPRRGSATPSSPWRSRRAAEAAPRPRRCPRASAARSTCACEPARLSGWPGRRPASPRSRGERRVMHPWIDEGETPLPALPQLKPWYRQAAVDGSLVLEHGQSAVVFGGAAATRLLPALLPLLDGSRPVAAIVDELGPAAEPAVLNAL